jgi:hypothetical protein
VVAVRLAGLPIPAAVAVVGGLKTLGQVEVVLGKGFGGGRPCGFAAHERLALAGVVLPLR